MAKIKIAVAGCLGRMGQELSKQIINNNKLEFIGGFEHKKHKDINKQFKNVSDINSTKLIDPHPANSIKTANVIIDFTTPQSTLENVKIASQNKTAVIIGTTGMTESQKKKVKSFAKKNSNSYVLQYESWCKFTF
jgi:4-hydroxy-tetrahydrodipicolinate reductase